MTTFTRHPPTPVLVALVEDDASFRDAVRAALEATPDLVVGPVAGTRAEALAMLAGPPAQVLLVDLSLPDGSGVDVIAAARGQWPACDVMVASALAHEAKVLACIEAGARGYLLKDTSPADIVAGIRALHAGGSPISPFIARRLLQRMQAQAPMTETAGQLALPEAAGQVALSGREAQVLQLVAKGFSYDEIARQLGVSHHTVPTFVRRIYAKLEVKSKMEAVNVARQRGWLAG